MRSETFPENRPVSAPNSERIRVLAVRTVSALREDGDGNHGWYVLHSKRGLA